MKAWFGVCAVMLAALAPAQVKLKMLVNGQQVGVTTLTQSIDRSGRLTQSMKGELSFRGNTAHLENISVVDKNGRPISEVDLETGGGQSQRIALTYQAKTVKVVRTLNGKSTTNTVQIPAGSILEPETFWFVTTRPKPGASATHMHLEPRTLLWKSQTTRYVGDDVVPGTKQKGHHMHSEDGEMWLDDRGMPIRIEHSQGGLKMVLAR